MDDRRAERRKVDYVTKDEFGVMDRRMERIEVALFAPDDDNDFGQAGLMKTARNIDHHITAVCSIAKWTRNLVIGALGLATAIISFAAALGIKLL